MHSRFKRVRHKSHVEDFSQILPRKLSSHDLNPRFNKSRQSDAIEMHDRDLIVLIFSWSAEIFNPFLIDYGISVYPLEEMPQFSQK